MGQLKTLLLSLAISILSLISLICAGIVLEMSAESHKQIEMRATSLTFVRTRIFCCFYQPSCCGEKSCISKFTMRFWRPENSKKKYLRQ